MDGLIGMATSGLTGLKGGMDNGPVQKIIAGFVETAKSLPEIVIKFTAVVSSLNVLLIMSLVGYVIYLLYSNGYLRFFTFAHRENMESINTQMARSTAHALVSYRNGVKIEYYKKGAPALSKEETIKVLSGITGRQNLYQKETEYKTFSKVLDDVSAIRKDVTPLNQMDAVALEGALDEQLQKEFDEKQPSAKTTPLRQWIEASQNHFNEQLIRQENGSLFNFMNPEPYMKGGANALTADKILRDFGKMAMWGNRPFGAIFTGDAEIQKLVSASKEEVIGHIQKVRADVERLKIKVTTSLVGPLLAAYGKNEVQLASAEAGFRKEWNSGPVAFIEKTLEDADKGKESSDIVPWESLGVRYLFILRMMNGHLDGLIRTFLTIEQQVQGLSSLDSAIVIEGLENLRTDMDILRTLYYNVVERVVILAVPISDEEKKKGSVRTEARVFTEAQKKDTLDSFVSLVSYLQFPLYYREICDALFLSLYLHLGVSSSVEREKVLQGLADFYLGFNELSLFDEYNKQVQTYREWDWVNKDTVWGFFEKKLLNPYYDQFITKAIWGEAWPTVTKYEKHFNDMRNTWTCYCNIFSNPATYLGGLLSSKPNECGACEKKETFVGGKEKTKEGFDLGIDLSKIFDPIIKPFNTIKDFFVKAFDLVVDMITVITNLVWMIGKPGEFVATIIKFVLYLIAGVVMLFLRIDIGYSIGHIWVTWLYIVFYVWPLFVATVVFNAAMFLMTISVGGIMTVLDYYMLDGKATRFFYNNFLACENNPDSWFSRAGFHKGNQFERKFGFFCYRPCGTNYEPAVGGLYCKRKESGEIPSFCPQALIMRIMKEKGLVYPYLLSDRVGRMDLGGMSRFQKIKISSVLSQMKGEYVTSCSANMGRYDSVVKNVCQQIDTLPLSTSEKEALGQVCYKTYCQNGRMEPWCYKYTDLKTGKKKESSFIRQPYLKQVLYYGTGIVAIGAVVFLLNENGLLKGSPLT